MIRCSRLHIKEEGMPGGIILTDHISYRRMDMFLRNVTVFWVSCLIGCPVQQRQIQQAVNDQAVILRCIHGPPCLNEFSYGMIAGDQLVRCLNCRFSALFAAGQLISCHAGRRIEKSHIVMIYFDLIVNTV